MEDVDSLHTDVYIHSMESQSIFTFVEIEKTDSNIQRCTKDLAQTIWKRRIKLEDQHHLISNLLYSYINQDSVGMV